MPMQASFWAKWPLRASLGREKSANDAECHGSFARGQMRDHRIGVLSPSGQGAVARQAHARVGRDGGDGAKHDGNITTLPSCCVRRNLASLPVTSKEGTAMARLTKARLPGALNVWSGRYTKAQEEAFYRAG